MFLEELLCSLRLHLLNHNDIYMYALADAFIQSDLQRIQVIYFVSVFKCSQTVILLNSIEMYNVLYSIKCNF